MVTHYYEQQHFQGYPEGLPKGFFIERQGREFFAFYDTDSYVQYGSVTAHETVIHRYPITFESYEDCKAFVDGFIAFLQWMNGIAVHPQQEVA